MKLDNKKLAKTLVDKLEGASPDEVSKIMKDFVSFLAEQNHLSEWRKIEVRIHQAWKEKYGASNVTIMSAHPLSEEAEEAFQKIAKGADITTLVDDRLIGGAVIRLDDTRIDGSITGALKRLKQTLSA